MSLPQYVIVDRRRLPASVPIVSEITPDLLQVLDTAKEMHVGRQVLVRLFEWFFQMVSEFYDKQPNVGKEEVVDNEFIDLLTKATKFGLRSWMAYEQIFNSTEDTDT